MSAGPVALLPTGPTCPWAQLALPSCIPILPPDLRVLQDLGQTPCLDAFSCCRRVAGDFEKECPDVSFYCFPCGCEHAVCSLKGQV